jgi:hypothetical protein
MNADTRRREAEQFVVGLYQGILRRDPDPAGLSHFVNSVLSGTSPAAVVDQLLKSEEFRMRPHAVKLCFPPGHYYSPIVDPAEAASHIAKIEATPIPDQLPGLVIDRHAMVACWRELAPLMAGNPFGDVATAPFHYYFDNPTYAWGDASVLHAILRFHRPKRLIEIGSGFSSACTFDTVERYLQDTCKLTFIEPYPALLHDLLGTSVARARILAMPVQQAPLEIFAELEAGDVLFIDSTHVLRTGSDVCFELFEILPRLARGVFVHFHDMFWPFEYPRVWAVDENRSWNELYAVRAFLLGNANWRVVMFNDYMHRLERPLIEATYPRFLKNSGGALWMQRV